MINDDHNFIIKNRNYRLLFSNGDLRKLDAGNEEFIQRIYFAVRDEEWLNVPYSLSNFTQQAIGAATIYSYDMLFKSNTIKFKVGIIITLEDNSIVLEARGNSLRTFKKNRIGFCIHLPATLKSTACAVTHTDGSRSEAVFPVLVSPHQPFKNLSEIAWQQKGWQVEINLEGDVFEMEDQRNWTDASYKIYSTPLDLPFPVEVKEGATFYQKIAIHLSSDASFIYPTTSKKEMTTLPETVRCPLFGLAEPDDLFFDKKSALTKIDSSCFAYYRIDFKLKDQLWKKKSEERIARAIALDLPVYAMLYFGKHFISEAEDFIDYINSYERIRLNFVCLLSYDHFVLPDHTLQTLANAIRAALPNAAVGAGTDANFAQLNRNRPDPVPLDFLCYSIQPQEHASDSLSIRENILGQADTVATAKNFSGGKAIHISALSFFKRFNTSTSFYQKENDKMPTYTGNHFEAAWFIGSLHPLIVAGAECITLYYPFSKEYPLTNVFQKMGENKPEMFYSCGSLQPEQYAVLAWKSGETRHAFFANLTGKFLDIIHPFAKLKLEPYGIQHIENRL